jgi:aryl-alcohol dehydrogenase-like predicted oxidoreductase
MQMRKLGWSELNFSTVGLGTWAMGGGDWKFGWGPQDDRNSIAAIHRALDLGINWIDTAAVYGLGHSEQVVGQALKGLSEKPYVATKCSRIWDADGNLSGNLKRDSLRKEVEASLRRLQVEVIDLYQVHWPNPDRDIEEGWAVIAELVKEGKVRYAGVCNYSVSQLQRIQPIHPVASLQPPYSMLRREIETDLLDYCAANRIGVVAYSPMQKGLLTGKFTPARAAALPEGDHRRNDPMFQQPALGRILALVDKLRPIAEKHNRSVAQLAIAWVLRQPAVTAAIVGARRPEQIEETAPAGDWTLTPEEQAAIQQLLAAAQGS